MEKNINQAKSNLNLFKNKGFQSTIINELLFYAYLTFFNGIVLAMLNNVEVSLYDGTSEIKNNIPEMRLAFLILIAFIFEIIGFIKIPAGKVHKTAILLFTSIPRLFLFWEISRLLMISFTHKITTGGSIVVFFLVPVLLLVTFILFGIKKEPETKMELTNKWDFQFLYTLPFYCIWYTLFEQVYLKDLWQGNWFVFIGIYSMFMYFPLKLPWIIYQIRNKSMSRWRIAMLIIQPVIVYLIVYKSLISN